MRGLHPEKHFPRAESFGGIIADNAIFSTGAYIVDIGIYGICFRGFFKCCCDYRQFIGGGELVIAVEYAYNVACCGVNSLAHGIIYAAICACNHFKAVPSCFILMAV